MPGWVSTETGRFGHIRWHRTRKWPFTKETRQDVTTNLRTDHIIFNSSFYNVYDTKLQINQFIQTSTCSYSDYTFYTHILLQLVTSCYILLQLVASCYILLNSVTTCYIMLHIVTTCYILLHFVTYCYILLHFVTSCYILLQLRHGG